MDREFATIRAQRDAAGLLTLEMTFHGGGTAVCRAGFGERAEESVTVTTGDAATPFGAGPAAIHRPRACSGGRWTVWMRPGGGSGARATAWARPTPGSFADSSRSCGARRPRIRARWTELRRCRRLRRQDCRSSTPGALSRYRRRRKGRRSGSRPYDFDRAVAVVPDLPTRRLQQPSDPVGLGEIPRRLRIFPPDRPADGPGALDGPAGVARRGWHCPDRPRRRADVPTLTAEVTPSTPSARCQAAIARGPRGHRRRAPRCRPRRS